MSEIELSTVVIDGLRSLNSEFSLDETKKIISNAVKKALHCNTNIPLDPDSYAPNEGYTKRAEYAILTLMFLAIKYDLDRVKLKDLLEKYGVSAMASEELISVYENDQMSLRIRNLTTGT